LQRVAAGLDTKKSIDPESLLAVRRAIPVPVLDSSIDAPGIVAPEASRTLPLTVAVDSWAGSLGATISRTAKAIKIF
jgi:hypothetical protein